MYRTGLCISNIFSPFFFSLQSKLYILSYTLSFHELIEFKADEDGELGTVSGKKKTFLNFFYFSGQANSMSIETTRMFGCRSRCYHCN